MKQTRMIVLIALLSVAAFAAAWSPPVDLSLQGIVNWMGMNGHISAGTSLPAVASSGTRFTLTSPNPARPVDYKSNGSAWLPMWTWNHTSLTNLSYSISGHGIVPVNLGGTGASTVASAQYNLNLYSIAAIDALLDDLSGVTQVASARTNLDVYSRDETDALTAQSSLQYFFSETDSDIVGYEAFATSPVAVQASEAITLGTTLDLIDQWVTPAGTPHLTTLVAGVYELESYRSKTGVGTAYTIAELWSRTSGGVETLIASSTLSAQSGVISSPELEVLRFTVTPPATVAATDRLVVKFYGYRGASVSGLVLWYGGATGSFFGVPISPRNFMRVDASNANLSEAQSNLGITADIQNLANHVASTGTLVHGLGTMSLATATDYAKLDTDATFTGRIDFGSASATDFTATPTIAGVDVFADINAALAAIIGG